jgi:hypothetical protein
MPETWGGVCPIGFIDRSRDRRDCCLVDANSLTFWNVLCAYFSIFIAGIGRKLRTARLRASADRISASCAAIDRGDVEQRLHDEKQRNARYGPDPVPACHRSKSLSLHDDRRRSHKKQRRLVLRLHGGRSREPQNRAPCFCGRYRDSFSGARSVGQSALFASERRSGSHR